MTCCFHTELDISFNEITRKVSSELGMSTKLSALQISNNFFSGTLLSTIGRVNDIVELYLALTNRFGNTPEEVCALGIQKIMPTILGSAPVLIGHSTTLEDTSCD